jgi:hypothetical protein
VVNQWPLFVGQFGIKMPEKTVIMDANDVIICHSRLREDFLSLTVKADRIK